MAIASNDVEHAVRNAGLANTEGRPEFSYWVRIANGFTFEGIRTLRAWRDEEESKSEIKKLLDRLPAPGKDALKRVNGVEQKMGSKALREVRDKTFHYPRPDRGYTPDSSEQLGTVLTAYADAGVEMDELDKQVRFTFADTVALSLAFGKHYPPSDPRFRAQQEEALKGATSFSNLTRFIVLAYLAENGVQVERR